MDHKTATEAVLRLVGMVNNEEWDMFGDEIVALQMFPEDMSDILVVAVSMFAAYTDKTDPEYFAKWVLAMNE